VGIECQLNMSNTCGDRMSIKYVGAVL
jgi:hypothetical protein